MKTSVIPYICALSICISAPAFASESSADSQPSYYSSTISDLTENTDLLHLPEQQDEEEFSGRFAYRRGPHFSDPEGEEETEEERSEEERINAELSQACMEFLPSPLEESEIPEKLPQMVELSVPELLQKPELPTGCESVALAIALKYKGYEVEKTTIADNYLVRTPSSNFVIGYVGDPYSEGGMGVYPPGLLLTAKKYLEDQEIEGEHLRNLTGTRLQDLFSFLSEGEPVVIWASMYMSDPEFSEYYGSIGEYEYQWYYSEHCMVLSGYDLKENTVTISDPLEGIVVRDLDQFNAIFEKTGLLSAII